MDPVSAIAAALIGGATAASSEMASQAIKDAYQALKRLLVDGYNFASASLLEKRPEDPAFQKAVENELGQTANLSADRQVLEKVKELQDALQSAPPAQLAAWGIDIKRINAGQDFIAERISGSGGGLRADEVTAGRDVRISDVSAGQTPLGKR